MTTTRIHAILERFCNLLRVEVRTRGASHDLQPVQWEALHFLSQCNRYSDTPLGVAEFLGQTKGSVSQSLKVLERRGLIRKRQDAKDRRVVHLQVTPAGRELVSSMVPARVIEQALGSLSALRAGRLRDDLEALLRAAQEANRGKSFAACKTCRFNQSGPEESRCGLTGEVLSESDVELICREHEYPESS